MDLIWQSRNKLIYEGALPNPSLAIQHLRVTIQSHYLAWQYVALPSLWQPPFSSCLKGNFDVAMCDNLVGAAAVISNFFGDIILAVTQMLNIFDVFIGKTSAAFLAICLLLLWVLEIFCSKRMLF